MAATLRQQILTAVDARLKTIATATGYYTNIGGNVFEWRAVPLTSGELPGIVWRDLDDAIWVTVGEHQHTLMLEVEIFVDGETAPATMRQAVADVTACVGTDVTWGGLAEDTRHAEREAIQIIHNERRIMGAVMNFEIVYRTAPFAAS